MYTATKTFSVTFVNEDLGINESIKVSDGELILDVAEQKFGIELPVSCRGGACTTCAAKLIKGTVEQTEQALHFLSREQLDAGYILPCACYATSDCIILTHQEDELF